jgi:hypothetical protein
MRRLAVAVLFVGLLVAGAAAPAAADSHSNTTTVESSGSEFTLEELRRGGEQITNAPPSLRWIGENSGVWVDYQDPNPLQDNSGSEWAAKTLLEPGTRVPRNEIRLHRQGTAATADETLTVHVVYWERGTETVRGERTTSEEAVATNVTHTTQEVRFNGAFDLATVDLRPHYDRPRQVTMWIEGHENTARWRFEHKSLESTKAIPAWINSQGDLMLWVGQNFVLWLFLSMLVLAGLTIGARNRAAAGPQKGYVWWIFVLGIGGFFAVALAWRFLSSIFVQGPQVLAFVTACFTMIPLIESQDENVRDVLTIKPEVTEAVTAGGTQGRDILNTESQDIRVARTPSGETMVLRRGIGAYISRLLGGGAVIDKVPDTTIAVDGHPKYDEFIWVHPKSDEPVRYDREGLNLWDPPSTLKGAAMAAGVVIVAALLTASWIGTPWVGALVASIPVVMSVEKGEAHIDPAPVHFRAAHATALYLSIEADQADTMEDALELAYTERANTHQRIQERSDQRDESLVEQTVGVGVDAAVGRVDDDRQPSDPEQDRLDEELSHLSDEATKRVKGLLPGGDDDD